MRTALVGGGASGIGHAVAGRLAGSGDRVVITGRHADTLEAAAVQLSGDTVGTALRAKCTLWSAT